VNLSPLPIQKFFDNAGRPLNGGLLFTYVAGTTTKLATYQNQAGTPNTNPIVLDFRGEANVWLDQTLTYKFVLAPEGDTDPPTRPIWSVDNISAAVTFASLTQQIIGQILWPRTAAEIAANVVPINYAFQPGYRPRYNTLADAAAVSGTHALYIFTDETIAAAVTLPTAAKVYGVDSPQITNSTAGSHVFNATSVAQIRIDGVRFLGANSSTVPLAGFGGYAAVDTGLVNITTCTDVRITNCEFSTFYNGLTAHNCTRLWIKNNRITHWLASGILASASSDFSIDSNDVIGCDQTGGVVAYGIQATGDEAGGKPEKRNSISFNRIADIPSWDGIESHDCDGLVIIGNDIRNVRIGIDMGHLVSTNFVRTLLIAQNYIQATTTDTWGGAAANHAGISVAGFDATHRVAGATIVGNTVDGFFAIPGATYGGIPSHIVVVQADDVTVSANTVKNGGTGGSSAAVYLNGTVNRVAVTGNTCQGTFGKGGIRAESLTSDALTIQGNTIKQTTASDNAVLLTGSTVAQLRCDVGATNSTAAFNQGTSTLTFSGDYLEGSATYDPPSLADGAGTTTTVTVTGAATGDFAVVSFGGDLSSLTVTAYVSAANTVSVRFQNESGGVVDLGSSTLRVRVFKQH